MPKEPRVVVEDLEAAPRLKARDIEPSSFRRGGDIPNPVQGVSSLGQLTAALSSFNNSLENFNQIYMQKSNQEAKEGALVDYYKDPDKYRNAAKGNVADFVKNGTISYLENPYRATTRLEITGQDLVEGEYASRLNARLKDVGEKSNEELQAIIGEERAKFQQEKLGNSYYVNLGASKAFGAVEGLWIRKAQDIVLDRSKAKSEEVLSSTIGRKLDDLMAGDLRNPEFKSQIVGDVKKILMEAHNGTLTKDVNASALQTLAGWVKANYDQDPMEVREIVKAVFEIDPRGDGNKLSDLRKDVYGEIEDWMDRNENDVLKRRVEKKNLEDSLLVDDVTNTTRTWINDRLLKTGSTQLTGDERVELDEYLQDKFKDAFASGKGGSIRDLVAKLAEEDRTLGSHYKSKLPPEQMERFERGASDPVRASKLLEDLRTQASLGNISRPDFKRLEDALVKAEKNNSLMENNEGFKFNSSALVDGIGTRLAGLDDQDPADSSRKASVTDEALRMYRSRLSQRLTAERELVPNETPEAFASRMATSPAYREEREAVEKEMDKKIRIQEDFVNKRKQAEQSMSKGEMPTSATGFFGKTFLSNSTLVKNFKEASVGMARYLSANPVAIRPEYITRIKEYAVEVKKYGEQELQKQGKIISNGGYYPYGERPASVTIKPGRGEGGIAPDLRGIASVANRMVGNEQKADFIPLKPEKLVEAKASFLSTLHQVGTSWANFVDSSTGKPRTAIRLYGVQVDPTTELNGLMIPLFSSKEEYNDVMSKPELVKSLCQIFNVDEADFRKNQALRVIEQGGF